MCCEKGQSMNHPYIADGVLCRYIGTNYGVRTVEGKEGRTYAAGLAAPRQRIHADDLELLAESFKPLHATVVATSIKHHSEVVGDAKAKRKPDTE